MNANVGPYLDGYLLTNLLYQLLSSGDYICALRGSKSWVKISKKTTSLSNWITLSQSTGDKIRIKILDIKQIFPSPSFPNRVAFLICSNDFINLWAVPWLNFKCIYLIPSGDRQVILILGTVNGGTIIPL